MRIRATPNAKRFGVEERDGTLIVRVPAKAHDGEANKAIAKALGEITGHKAAVVGGHKSRDKTIAFQGMDDEEARKKILAQRQPNSR